MSIEDLNYNELNSMENEIRARREEIKTTTQHYGSAENLSRSDTEFEQARKQELQALSQNLNKDNLNKDNLEESLNSTKGVR